MNFLHHWWQNIKTDPLIRRVIRNSGYLFSSNTINMGLSVVQGSFAAHLLGAELLGVVGIITSYASTVNRLFSFRMGELVVRYFTDYIASEETDKAAALVKAAALLEAGSSVLAFLLLMISAPLAARFITKDVAYLQWFWLYGLIIPAHLVTETSLGILQVDNQFRNQALINVSQGVLTAALIVLAFFRQAGFEAVLIAYLLGKVILGVAPMVLALRSLRRMLPQGWIRTPFSVLPSWKKLMRFAWGSNFSATINLLVRDAEVLWVGLFLSPLEAGYFKIAYAINNFVLMPITPFISTTYPELTRSVSGKLWGQLRRLLRRVTMISGGWTLLAGIGLVLFGPWLIPLYAGAEFLPAYPAMLVLLVGFGFANIFFWNRALLLSFDLPMYAFKVMLYTGLVKILLAFWVVPRFGYVGEAALLSLYFLVSIGIILWRGFAELRRFEAVNETAGVN